MNSGVTPGNGAADHWHADRVAAEIEAATPELVEAISAAVRIPSVVPSFPGEERGSHVGREGDVSRLVAGLLADAGCEIDVFGLEPGRENCVAVLRGSGEGRSLILNGHVDVVPPQPAEQWADGDPWSGRVANGRIRGRGSCDMKGGLMAAVFAVRAIARAGGLRGDLILHAVVGEEMMEHDLGTTACLERGYGADGAVVAEPSPHGAPLSVCPTTPGVMWFTVTVRGRGAHAGMRAESLRPGGAGTSVGVNAADLTLALQSALADLEAGWIKTKRHPLFRTGSFTVHTGVVQASPDAGPMPFGLAEHGILECIVWYSPDDEAEQVRAEIESCIDRVTRSDPWLTEHPAAIEWRHDWPPSDLPADHALVDAVAKAHHAANGNEPRIEAFSAVADVTYYGRAGIPALTYGPGDIALAHALDESIAIDEIVAACRTYARLAQFWCGA